MHRSPATALCAIVVLGLSCRPTIDLGGDFDAAAGGSAGGTAGGSAGGTAGGSAGGTPGQDAGPTPLTCARLSGTAGFPQGVALFPDGSFATVGYFFTSVTLGAGEARQTTLVSSGSTDLFVARFNSDCTLAWARQAGGLQSDSANAVAVAPDGTAITVSGQFDVNATFGGGEPNQTMLTASGGSDAFVAVFEVDGRLRWARGFGGSSGNTEQGYTAAVHSDGTSYVSGRLYGTVTFGAGEPSETTWDAGSSYFMYLARYRPDGALLWARIGSGFAYPYSLTLETDGSAYVAGWFGGPLSFDRPDGGAVLSTGSFYEGFVARFRPDGEVVWAKDIDAPPQAFPPTITPRSIDVDEASQTLLVSGTLGSEFSFPVYTFGPGEPNETILEIEAQFVQFVARYRIADGTLVWAKNIGGEIGWVADGTFVGTRGLSLARYDADGGLLWSRLEPGISRTITVAPSGSFVVTGRITTTATFGLGGPNETTLQAPDGGGYVAVFGP